jgi:hypothetical protein
MKPSTTVDSVLLAPITAATTERTANLDISDANYATIRVAISAEASTHSTNVAIQLSESDDTVVTNFATFDATFNRTVDNTAATVATSHIDCEGRKKLIRLTVTPDTVATAGAVISSAVASLHKVVMSGTDSDYGPNVVIG